MMKRATFTIVVAAVLLVSSHASGNLTGTLSPGTFSHPPCGPTVVCSGQGTNTFSYGDNPSTGKFTPGRPFDDPRRMKIVVGQLDFFNSALTLGTEVTSVHLTFSSGDIVATGADSPLFDTVFDNYLFSLTLTINTTLNTADPVASRDDIVVTRSVVTIPGIGVRDFTFDYNPNVFSVNENALNSVEMKACFCSFELVG